MSKSTTVQYRGSGRRQRSRGFVAAVATVLAGAPLLAMAPASAAVVAPRSATPAFLAVGSAPRIPYGARQIGTVTASSTETGAVVLTPRDSAGLTRFIAEATNKESASYRDYLPAGAFEQRFGPTVATIDAVRSVLTADGLRVTGVTSDGLLVTFSGSAACVGSAFHTGFASYRLANGQMGQATTSAVEVPSAIAHSVTAVVGLDNLVQSQPAGLVRRPLTGKSPFPPAKSLPHFTHPAGSPDACSAASEDAQAFGGLTDDQIANFLRGLRLVWSR